MRSLIDYFDCGKYYTSASGHDGRYQVTKYSDLIEKIIPFFILNPIRGVKSLDFDDWCKVAEIVKTKDHLTKKGLDQIFQLKAGMNKGR